MRERIDGFAHSEDFVITHAAINRQNLLLRLRAYAHGRPLRFEKPALSLVEGLAVNGNFCKAMTYKKTAYLSSDDFLAKLCALCACAKPGLRLCGE